MRDYKFTGTMRPVYPLSEKRAIPDHIVKPDYADHRMLLSHYPADIIAQGFSQCEAVRERSVKILTKEEIEGMRKVCRVGLSVLMFETREELMYSLLEKCWT
jgi:methionyl aminopeptidase